MLPDSVPEYDPRTGEFGIPARLPRELVDGFYQFWLDRGSPDDSDELFDLALDYVMFDETHGPWAEANRRYDEDTDEWAEANESACEYGREWVYGMLKAIGRAYGHELGDNRARIFGVFENPVRVNPAKLKRRLV